MVPELLLSLMWQLQATTTTAVVCGSIPSALFVLSLSLPLRPSRSFCALLLFCLDARAFVRFLRHRFEISLSLSSFALLFLRLPVARVRARNDRCLAAARI